MHGEPAQGQGVDDFVLPRRVGDAHPACLEDGLEGVDGGEQGGRGEGAEGVGENGPEHWDEVLGGGWVRWGCA